MEDEAYTLLTEPVDRSDYERLVISKSIAISSKRIADALDKMLNTLRQDIYMAIVNGRK